MEPHSEPYCSWMTEHFMHDTLRVNAQSIPSIWNVFLTVSGKYRNIHCEHNQTWQPRSGPRFSSDHHWCCCKQEFETFFSHIPTRFQPQTTSKISLKKLFDSDSMCRGRLDRTMRRARSLLLHLTSRKKRPTWFRYELHAKKRKSFLSKILTNASLSGKKTQNQSYEFEKRAHSKTSACAWQTVLDVTAVLKWELFNAW